MPVRITRHLVLLLIAALWIAMVIHSLEYLGRFMFHTLLVSVRWLQVLFIGLSLYGSGLLLLSVRHRPGPPRENGVMPFVSILIPVKDEERVIEGTLQSLARLEYHAAGRRRFEVIVIDDRSTDATPRLLRHLRRLLRRELGLGIVRTPAGSRGKAAALNFGVRYARGDLLAFFDADARVAPDVLQRMVACLDGERVAGVQGRRLPYNAAQNALTRMQEDEFAIMLTHLQRGREAAGTFVSLAGNGMLMRRDALANVGGWNEEALTEDIDLSVRFYLAGWRIRYCEEAIVGEEAVPAIGALIRQRTRWFEGGMRCLGEHLPAILVARLPLHLRFDIILFLGGSLVATLALLTTYAYALVGLAGVVVLFLQVPHEVMVGVSCFFTIGVLAAVVEGRGWRPTTVAGILLRFALFSLHRVVVVPLAIVRYVHAAITGKMEWAKTIHLGEMAPDGLGEPHPSYIRRV
jgi:1,2-diacylglycerol 3-beta-glucosyltransferase